MILLDIDHFKSINDRWGHDEGDRVLRGLGQALTDLRPRPEIAARAGGRGILPGLRGRRRPRGAAGERGPARHLRRAPAPSRWQPVRFSAGIAQSDGADGSMEAVYSRADRALYQAKAGGRDCAVIGLTEAARAA